MAGAFLVATMAAFFLDVWLRFWILPRHRHREVDRIAAVNRATRMWGHVMFSLARWALGLNVTVEGRVPASGRFLIVANHQSSLDIPLLILTFRALNLKFVAMEQLRRGKLLISLVIRHGGFVSVGKKNIGEDLAALTRFAAELERFNGSPVIFPAGGLERDQGARRFYLAGIEVLRRGSRLPILPVAIDGMGRAPTVGDILHIAGSRVTIRISEPIPCEVADQDPRATYLWLEEKIYRDLAQIRGDDPSDSGPAGSSIDGDGGTTGSGTRDLGVSGALPGTSAGRRAE